MNTEAINTIDQLKKEIKQLNSKIEKLEKASANHRLTTEKFQDELIDRDKRYPELFNNMSEGFAHCEIIFDEKGIPSDYRVLNVNKAYEIQTGIKAETIVGKTVLEVFPDIEKSWINIFGQIALTRIPKTFVNFNHNTDKYYETTSFSPKKGFFSLLFRDITTQKLTEQNLKKSEKRYSDIISGLVWAVAIHVNNKIVFVNDALKNLVGISNDEEIIGRNVLEFVHPEDQERVINAIQLAYAYPNSGSGSTPTIIEERLIRNDGTERIVEASAILMDYDGEDALVVTLNDITDQKLAQKAVSKSEARYRLIAENTQDIISLHTFDHKLSPTYVSPSIKIISGYLPEELLGLSIFDFLHPDDKKGLIKELKLYMGYKLKKMLKGHNIPVSKTFEYRMKHKSGNWLFAQSTVSIVGKQLVSITRDITAAKIAEQALQQSEAFNREIVDNSFDCIKILDLEANLQFMSKGGQKRLEIKNINDYIGKSWFDLFTDKDRKSALAAVKKAKSGEIGRVKSYIPTENGKPMWWDAIVTPIVGEKGTPTSLLAISRDITKETQITIELKESQSNLISLINNTEDSIWSVDLNYDYIIFNKAYATFFYTTYGVELKKGMNAKKMMKSDEYNFWKPLIGAAFKGEKQVLEFPEELPDGKHFFQVLLNPIYEDNSIVGASVMRIDITKSMQNVIALKDSEARFKALHNASFGGIAIHDKGLILDCNQGLSEISGYQANELIGMDGLLLIAEESRKRVMDNILAEYEKPYEAIGIKKNGEKYPLRLAGKMIPYKGQQVRVVEFRDITEQKQAEEEIFKSETRFRELVENINSGVGVYEVLNDGMSGADYIVKDFNKAALFIEGLTKKEVLGKSLLELRPNIDEFGLIPVFRKTWKTGKTIFFPAKQYIDNKYESYYENRVYRLPGGEVVAVYDDVTERENSILEIAKSRNRFDLAMNASKDGLFDWNLETSEIYYSPGWKKMLGYSDDELPNDFTVWEKLTDPEHIKKSWEMQQELINKQRDRFELEFKMKHKGGHWVDILSRAEAVFDENGKAIRIVGTHVDISQSKQAEEEIYRLKNAVDDSFFGVVMASMDGTNFYMNNAAYTLFGYDPERDFAESSYPGTGWAEMEKFEFALKKLKAKGLWKGDMLAKRKDGSRFDCYTSATVIHNLEGEPQHIIAYYLDITDRKQAEEAVKKLNDELEQKVMERTENLEKKNKELARMNKLFVGRELRMVELKNMIKELEEKLINKG